MNPGRISNIRLVVGINNVFRGSDEEKVQWESMFTTYLLLSGRSSSARF